MKKLMITLLTSIAALTTQAQATSLAPELPLVRLQLGGGMPAPGGLNSLNLVMTNYGKMTLTKTMYGNFEQGSQQTTEVKELGYVPTDDLVAITNTVAKIKEGKFVQPKGPECLDAPAYFYSAYAADGKQIKIYEVVNCREYKLQNKKHRAAAKKLKEFLDKTLQQAR